MKFIADFHIHSHYSIATSKYLIPEHLNRWAQLKGIKVVGTGDLAHPGWLKELKAKMEPAEQGLYKLKDELAKSDELQVFDSCKNDVRFILTAEISCIYKKNDKVRKVHNLVFAPDFEAVRRIQSALSRIGNITSDGRPILGLDSRDLLEIVLTASPDCFLVPAHIWTPWFSVLGSKSGFDSIDECYGDLAEHIFAVETGLSSDPAMNWMCSFLDRFSIISNSDAHSPENLGREANLFDADLSYNGIRSALKHPEKKEFLGTLEFFPEEGKYHFDGHRKCGICWDPVESIKHGGICPVCGKKVTLGVMYRVAELADREDIKTHPNPLPYDSIVPLKEILSEILGVGKASKRLNENYLGFLNKFGSEFDLLLNVPYEDLKKENTLLAEGISRMREGRVYISEGFDGEFGRIKVFSEDEVNDIKQKTLFFIDDHKKQELTPAKRKSSEIDVGEFRKAKAAQESGLFSEVFAEPAKVDEEQAEELNSSQLKAVEHINGPSIIIAGPGTGKTKTLTHRIAKLVKSNIDPENILALTFSNQAAKEIASRVKAMLDNTELSDKIKIMTFHSFGLHILEENIDKLRSSKNYSIINTRDKEIILKDMLNLKQSETKKVISKISDFKQKLISIDEIEDEDVRKHYLDYNAVLEQNNLFDFDDLLYLPIKLFKEHSDILKTWQEKYKWISIDEYQDINYAQYRLIRMLAPDGSANITVIGDPNQAIYGFRGADVSYINEFKNDYPDAAFFKLDKSYRCSDNILSASHQIVQEDGKELFYLKGVEKGVKLKINEYGTQKTEAEFVARQIEKMIGGLRSFSMDSGISDGNVDEEILSLSDFAVLCRIGKQTTYIENAFIEHAIPYQKIGERPFYTNPPFSDIIDLIRFIINPDNLFLKASVSKMGINDADIIDFRADLDNKKLNECIKKISDKYFKDALNENKNGFDLFFDLAKEHDDNPEEFIKFAETSQSVDLLKKKSESVKIMTMHAAKGLEFNSVFIVGCSDKILPFSIYKDYEVDIEEEKRLLYVSMTRAKKNLFLTYSQTIELFGQNVKVNKSPFITKIKDELVTFEKQKARAKKEKQDDGQLSLF